MPSRNQGAVVTYEAYNTSTGAYQTGDSGNHTLRLVKDGTEAAPTNSPSEIDATNLPGMYALALASAETNFNLVTIGGKSSTANVILISKIIGFENLPVPLTNTSQAQFGVNVVTVNGAPANTSSASLGVNLVTILGAGVSPTTAQLGVNVVQYNAQTAQTDANNFPKVDVEAVKAVLTSTSAAMMGVNVVTYAGNTVLVPAVSGVPKVDVADIGGAAVNTAAAQLGVNAVNIAGQAAQLDANNLLKTDVEDIKGVAVNTAVAQIGANTVNWGGSPTAGNVPPDIVFTPGQHATFQSGSSATTVTLVSGSSNITDFYKWQTIVLHSGLGAGESATVINYNPTTKTATINGTWAQNPSGGDGYTLIANGQVSAVAALSGISNVNVQQWAGGAVPAPNVTGEPLVDVNHWRGTQPNTLISNRVDVSAGAMAAGVITTTAFAAGALTTSVFAANYLTGALIDTTAGSTLANDLLDLANGIETGVTPRQAWRYIAAAEAGVTAGALTTSFTIAAIGNAGTNRITATTTASGNRSAVTLN